MKHFQKALTRYPQRPQRLQYVSQEDLRRLLIRDRGATLQALEPWEGKTSRLQIIANSALVVLVRQPLGKLVLRRIWERLHVYGLAVVWCSEKAQSGDGAMAAARPQPA
jgi:hypothetical protein